MFLFTKTDLSLILSLLLSIAIFMNMWQYLFQKSSGTPDVTVSVFFVQNDKLEEIYSVCHVGDFHAIRLLGIQNLSRKQQNQVIENSYSSVSSPSPRLRSWRVVIHHLDLPRNARAMSQMF
jgi:hypothetical protein